MVIAGILAQADVWEQEAHKLTLAPAARTAHGKPSSNSELADDICFSNHNTSSSKKQMGNVENSDRFRDTYIQNLGLGAAWDYDREEKAASMKTMHFGDFSAVQMIRMVGFSLSADEAHRHYVAAIPLADWRDQMKNAVAMFASLSSSDMQHVLGQILYQGPDELQYFEQILLPGVDKARAISTFRYDENFQRIHARKRVGPGRCGSAMAILQTGKPTVVATAIAFAAAMVANLAGDVLLLPFLVADTYEVFGFDSFGQNIKANPVPRQARTIFGFASDLDIHQAAFQLRVSQGPAAPANGYNHHGANIDTTVMTVVVADFFCLHRSISNRAYLAELRHERFRLLWLVDADELVATGKLQQFSKMSHSFNLYLHILIHLACRLFFIYST